MSQEGQQQSEMHSGQSVQSIWYAEPHHDKPISLGEWIWTLILSAIPIVNFIMLLVWSFSSGTNRSKKNYARATLILSIIGIIFYVIFLVAVVGSMTGVPGDFLTGFSDGLVE